ncbi:MAG: patatin-like phospholipase family protein [Candidatus Binatia bacterium]
MDLDGHTVGVALSSGGASSLAQIGALEVLLEAGIPIDVVAGTSGGSIIGAVLAAGKLAEFREAVTAFTPRRLFSLVSLVWTRGALLELGPAIDFTRPFVTERIEDLGKRFGAVAVDLATGAEVVLRTGAVGEAIRASCAIPGVFPPCQSDGRWLADGALANPVPVDVARDLGARFVIAINALFVDRDHAARFSRECTPTKTGLRDFLAAAFRRDVVADLEQAVAESAIERVPGSSEGLRWLAVLAQASRIVQCRIAAARLRRSPPDASIDIAAGDVGVFDFHRAADLIELGREAATSALPGIHRALASRSRARRRLQEWWRSRGRPAGAPQTAALAMR